MGRAGKLLPPLDYLLAFEAAAQHGSFARAGRLLNISETSISRKVRLLEQHYDVPLFVRGHRSVTLTPQGHSLLVPVQQAMNQLRNTSQDMLSKHQRNTVTVSATNSVAALWLMPRLARFNRANPRIRITLIASDDDGECLADTVDLAILRGEGHWPCFQASQLFGETVFPVCSPDYLEAHPELDCAAALPRHDLIEVANQHTEWMNWRTWLTQNHVNYDLTHDTGSRIQLNTYPLAVQAAVDGLGVALGWAHLVDRQLEAGSLVRPLGDTCLRTKSGYHLLRPTEQQAFPERQIVEDWLLQESAARKRYTPPPAQPAHSLG